MIYGGSSDDNPFIILKPRWNDLTNFIAFDFETARITHTRSFKGFYFPW